MTIFSAGALEAGTFDPPFCWIGVCPEAQGPAWTELCLPGGGGSNPLGCRGEDLEKGEKRPKVIHGLKRNINKFLSTKAKGSGVREWAGRQFMTVRRRSHPERQK